MPVNPFDIAQRRQVLLERLKAGETEKFVTILREMDRVLRDRLSAADITGYQRQRVERLIADVAERLAVILGEWRGKYTESMIDVGKTEAAWEARALNDSTIKTFEAALPTTEQIRQAIELTPVSIQGPGGGQMLQQFLDGWQQKQIDGYAGAIRRGYYEGKTTAQIVRDIRGSRELQFSDGMIATTQRSAQAIVKTTIQDAATKAREETLRQNSSVVRGVIWLSTLDERTSGICQALDGRRFPIDEGPRPPAHVNCRSTIIPDIDPAFSALQRNSTRASMDGPVSGKQTYYEWLIKQPEKFQDEALGPKRAALLRDGGLSAEQFSKLQLGENFEPLTLKEMRELEPVAFERAGI